MAPLGPALLCFSARVCHLANNQPNYPIPLLMLFLLFFREPIGKKRSGKDSFPVRRFHQLLLSPTAVVSWNGTRVQPHGGPTPSCAPPWGVGLPNTACPLCPSRVSLQPPSPGLTSPCASHGAPKGGMDARSSPRCADLPVHSLTESLPLLLPPPCSFPSPPHALSPVILFLHQGLSRERPLSCREVVTTARYLALALALPFARGTPARAGWASPLQEAVTSPRSFLWWLVDTEQ